MDLDDFRMILSNSRADVWDFIDAAIAVASTDYGEELKDRRDGIVERLYASSVSSSRCKNCDVDEKKNKVVSEKENKRGSSSTPQSIHNGGDDDDDNEEDEHVDVDQNDEERDPYGGLFDDDEDEETKILRIKDSLEDPDQSEDSVVDLLQSLADMDITFKALKETDIGRHVNYLRKHPSNDVRRLVKQLVRKWKDLVDEWVKLNNNNNNNTHELASSSLIADGDSPLQQKETMRNTQNGLHHQVPDFAYSPNPHNGSSSSEKNNNSEPEPKAKAATIPRRDTAPVKPPHFIPKAASAPPPMRHQKESNIDMERLASARKRLQENYQEAQNAKRQRTIQVMDIHDIPKPKNTFFAKNKGGSQGRHR